MSVVRENTYNLGENKSELNVLAVTRRPVNPSQAIRREVSVVDVLCY